MCVFVFHKSLSSWTLQLGSSAIAEHSVKFHFSITWTRFLVCIIGGILIQLHWWLTGIPTALLWGRLERHVLPTNTHIHTQSFFPSPQTTPAEVFWGAGFSVRYCPESDYPKLAKPQNREGTVLSTGKWFILPPITPLRSFRYRWNHSNLHRCGLLSLERGAALINLHPDRRVHKSHLLQKASGRKTLTMFSLFSTW